RSGTSAAHRPAFPSCLPVPSSRSPPEYPQVGNSHARGGRVRLVLGRYELLERIGRGGMADVFRAHDRSLERDIALKMMRPEFAGGAGFVVRFHRDAVAFVSSRRTKIR